MFKNTTVVCVDRVLFVRVDLHVSLCWQQHPNCEQLVSRIHLPFVKVALHLTKKQKSNGVRYGDLGGHILVIVPNSTYVHSRGFSQNDRYFHLPKSFFLNHPVFTSIKENLEPQSTG
jgi:hypothetical protein